MVIKVEMLKKAIFNVYNFEGLRLSEDAAQDIAESILSFFGYERYIIDNILSNHCRSIFYEMEDKGILKRINTVELLNTIWYRGSKLWQLNMWELNMPKIKELAKGYEIIKNNLAKDNLPKKYESIFESLGAGKTPWDSFKSFDREEVTTDMLRKNGNSDIANLKSKNTGTKNIESEKPAFTMIKGRKHKELK